MADVKIIDIDSEQWNMKDQNARNRLDVIERRNTVESKEVTQGYCYLNMAKKNGIVTCYIRYKPTTAPAGTTVQFAEIVPVGWRPAIATRNQFVTSNDDTYKGQMLLRENGTLEIWSGVGSFVDNKDYTTSITYVCED